MLLFLSFSTVSCFEVLSFFHYSLYLQERGLKHSNDSLFQTRPLISVPSFPFLIRTSEVSSVLKYYRIPFTPSVCRKEGLRYSIGSFSVFSSPFYEYYCLCSFLYQQCHPCWSIISHLLLPLSAGKTNSNTVWALFLYPVRPLISSASVLLTISTAISIRVLSFSYLSFISRKSNDLWAKVCALFFPVCPLISTISIRL